MNIKQAEAQSGVSRRNIRFYEAQGLLLPGRNAANSYREYTDEDIRTLKLIRMLRMTDMPLEDIRSTLSGSHSLAEAAARQKDRLCRRQEELLGAIRLCDGLQGQQIQTLDIDQVLTQAAAPQKTGGFFAGWVDDYKAFARAQHELRFTFFPDGAVTNPQEFSDALFAYARDNGLDLVITRESMYPEFTIDGIPFTAQRNYTHVQGIPVASILCTAVHADAMLPPACPVRRWMQRFLNAGLPMVLPLVFSIYLWFASDDASRREPGFWVVLVSFWVLGGVLSVRNYYLTFNENGKRGPEHRNKTF